MSFSLSDGTFFLGTDGGGGPSFFTPWQGSLSLNLGSVLTSEAVPFAIGATRISFDYVNALTAFSEEESRQAEIVKNAHAISVTTLNSSENVIPELSSLSAWSLLSLIGLGIASRRLGRRHVNRNCLINTCRRFATPDTS